MQSRFMQNAGMDEVVAWATDNAEKRNIPKHLPKKRKNVREGNR